MKKIAIFHFAFLLAFALSAHDYQVIQSDRVCLFSEMGSLNEVYSTKAYRVDSVKLIGTDSVFYPNVNFMQSGNYIKANGSWIGRKIEVRNNGINIIYNHLNELIELRTQAKINEEWVMFQRGDQIKATAKVTSITQENFLDLSDSVKTITIQLVDLRYNYIQVPPPVVIKISKNFGIIQAREFYSFPDIQYSHSFVISGLTNPNVGIQNLLWHDVWDIKSGTELHYLYKQSDSSNPMKCNYSKCKFIYTGHYESQDSIHISGVYFQQDSLFNSDSVPPIRSQSFVNRVLKRNIDFDQLPGTPISDGYQNSRYFSIYSQLNNVKGMNSDEGYYFQDSCYVKNYTTVDCFSWCGCSYGASFQKNLGSTDNSLVYYKKGEVIWGKPLIITALLNPSVQLRAKVNYLSLSKRLQVRINEQELPVNFELYDLTGKLLLSKILYTTDNLFTLQNISEGAFIYKLTSDKRAIQSGKLLLHR